MQLQIDHNQGNRDARRFLQLLADAVEPVVWHKRWGVRVRDHARRNARGKGGRRFWRQIADSVRLGEVDARGAVVYSDHVAAGQKERGGVIRARNAGALTIPIAREAYGKRAGEFELGGRELFTITSGKGNTLLGYRDESAAKKTKAFRPLYLLKKSVSQRPEPFFPFPRQIADHGIDEGLRLLDKAK